MKKASRGLVSRYARSLFGAAQERQVVDAVRRDLEKLHLLWDGNPELKSLLINPGLSRAKVKAIVAALMAKLGLNLMTRAFVDILLEKDRLSILSEIHPAFEQLMRVYEGKIEVTVTTAVPVTGRLQKDIEQHLKNKSGKDPVVEWRENPAIIGGIVIEWPDRVFDGSVARKIENLKMQLAGSA